MEQVNPIDEARRYVANALEIIEKSKYDPETKLYKDKKYVRIAGDTLWKGCLIALDAVFQVRKGKGRPPDSIWPTISLTAVPCCTLGMRVREP